MNKKLFCKMVRDAFNKRSWIEELYSGGIFAGYTIVGTSMPDPRTIVVSFKASPEDTGCGYTPIPLDKQEAMTATYTLKDDVLYECWDGKSGAHPVFSFEDWENVWDEVDFMCEVDEFFEKYPMLKKAPQAYLLVRTHDGEVDDVRVFESLEKAQTQLEKSLAGYIDEDGYVFEVSKKPFGSDGQWIEYRTVGNEYRSCYKTITLGIKAVTTIQ